jgi:hypothetical protein
MEVIGKNQGTFDPSQTQSIIKTRYPLQCNCLHKTSRCNVSGSLAEVLAIRSGNRSQLQAFCLARDMRAHSIPTRSSNNRIRDPALGYRGSWQYLLWTVGRATKSRINWRVHRSCRIGRSLYFCPFRLPVWRRTSWPIGRQLQGASCPRGIGKPDTSFPDVYRRRTPSEDPPHPTPSRILLAPSNSPACVTLDEAFVACEMRAWPTAIIK